MNISETRLILKQLNITPQKKLGQNFLIDQNVVQKIINTSQITRNDLILEIGPGLGAITEQLVKKAKKIHAIEINGRFCKYLEEKFSSYNNIEIINGDILQVDLPSFGKVVSNIPYTMTGPIFEKIFFTHDPPVGIMIIEKRISDRIFYVGDYNNFSRITVTSNSFLFPAEKINISRTCFYPVPKINLSLIKVEPRKDIDDYLKNKKSRTFYLKFIAGIMPFKNKNIANAIYFFLKNNAIMGFEKERIKSILKENNYKNEKLAVFKIKEFIEISKIFYNFTLG